MAQANCLSNRATLASTSPILIAVTLGRARTRARWRGISSSGSTFALAMYVIGAPSNAPGDRIMKKFVEKLPQSTVLVLSTTARRGVPCISNSSVDPRSTPRFSAASSSTDTRMGFRVWSSFRSSSDSDGHHRPFATILSLGSSESAVSTYSRVKYQPFRLSLCSSG